MLGSIGMPELLIVLVIALVMFGPRRLPELGRSLGRARVEFRRATSDLPTALEQGIEADDRRTTASNPALDSGRSDSQKQ